MTYMNAQVMKAVKLDKFPMEAPVKSKASFISCVLGFALTVHSQNANLAYRPYPILLRRRDKYYGYGRVNAYRALSQVGSVRRPPPSLSQRLNSQIGALNIFTADGRRVFKSAPAFGIKGFTLTKP